MVAKDISDADFGVEWMMEGDDKKSEEERRES
jgi:hypothetical protein